MWPTAEETRPAAEAERRAASHAKAWHAGIRSTWCRCWLVLGCYYCLDCFFAVAVAVISVASPSPPSALDFFFLLFSLLGITPLDLFITIFSTLHHTRLVKCCCQRRLSAAQRNRTQILSQRVTHLPFSTVWCHHSRRACGSSYEWRQNCVVRVSTHDASVGSLQVLARILVLYVHHGFLNI